MEPQHPRRIQLSGNDHDGLCLAHSNLKFAPPYCYGNERHSIPSLLHISKEFRDEATRVYGHAELKIETNHKFGKFVHLKEDIIILSHTCSSAWTANRLKAALERVGILDMIKAIAVHVRHPDFKNFIASFKLYGNLELVFIMTQPSGGEPARFRKWNSNHEGLESRISCEKEAMFEVLEEKWERSCSCKACGTYSTTIDLEESDICMAHLCSMMARQDAGKLVTPNIRYVRMLHYRPINSPKYLRYGDGIDRWDD